MQRGLWLCLALMAGLSACDSFRYYGGRFYHETKRWGWAQRRLELFVEKAPDDPRACDAHLRLGRLYADVYDRPVEARRHFEAAARGFPKDTACVEAAKAGILSAPDYFPLAAGRVWVYGDSASGGRAMRLEVEARPEGKLVSSLFAGQKRLSSEEKAYAKRDWEVVEVGAAKPAPVLRYPYARGTRWSASRGKDRVSYLIESDGMEVKTKAGLFKGCVKVRESNAAFRGSWKYDYYCPGVGKVKTTVGGPGIESPNTELLSFQR